MSNLDLSTLANALEDTQVASKGVDFAGRTLRLNSEADGTRKTQVLLFFKKIHL